MPAESHLSRLPPELTDRIIDFLWNDRQTLRACSLTCTAWRASSQYHLFSLLALDAPREAVDARLDGLRGHPRLLGHVRLLRFAERGWMPWDRFAQSLHARLPGVRLTGAAFVARQQRVATTLPFTAPLYASLQSLVLRGAMFGSAAHFALALAPLRGLRSLELDPLLLADAAPADVCPQFERPCATRMTLADERLAALAPWIESGGQHGNVLLRALSATLSAENLDAFDAVLRSQADALWMFRIMVSGPITDQMRDAFCGSMSHCRSLKILIFEPEAYIPDDDFIGLVSAVIRSAVRPARLIVNTGGLCHARHDAFGGLDWEQLDEAAFAARTTTVQISADAPDWWNSQFEMRTRATLENALPRLARAGRLTFVPTRKEYNV